MITVSDAPRMGSRLTDAIAASERIALLDILRGLALFGMILVHFHQKMRLPASGVEGAIGWFVWIFVEQKAWGTFAFLFGVGFAVLLRRVEARGAPVVPLYLRRLAALALVGAVAEVCFGFTILFDYAFWGVALLFLRRLSTRALLVAAAVAMCAIPVIFEVRALHWWWTGATPPRPSTNLASVIAAQESYLAVLRLRLSLFASQIPHTWRDFLPNVNLALFILGLLAVRHRVLEEPRRHVRLIVGWMIFGASSWGTAWLVQMLVQPRLPTMPAPFIPLLYAFGFVDDQWLCLTYVGAATLLLAYRPAWTGRLALFGQVGRMALTNYMVQIAVLDVLASKYGFGLKLRPYAYLGASILLFSAEAGFTRLWLARYRFGPVEWLWRTVTYMRRQPLERDAIQSVQAASV